MAAHAPLPELLDAHDLSTSRRQSAKYATESSGHVGSAAAARFEFRKKAQFAWKVGTLLITFLALIPVLYFQNETGAVWYLAFLVFVHVVGLAIFLIGVSKEDVAPSTGGFVGRLIGLVSVGILLFFASKGLRSDFGSLVFWGSLFGLWFIHTAGLALLHIRGRKETACPFV